MNAVRYVLYSDLTHSRWMNIGKRVVCAVSEKVMVVVGIDALSGNNIWTQWIRSIIIEQVENEIDFV